MGAWQAVLLEPARLVLAQVGQFVVSAILVILILIIGWMISKFIRTVVLRLLTAIKLDTLSDRIELTALLEKGGIKYALSELISVICYWLAILVTFVVAINAVGLTAAADLLNKIILYIPNIIAVIFIFILGMFVATLLRNIVQTAATNAGLSQVKVLGKIVEVMVIVFAIAIALEQLKIGTNTVSLIISITLASMGLGFALAFGLGCKDIAGKFLGELIEKIKK